jgi:DNA polymerase-3 subunit epsilon
VWRADDAEIAAHVALVADLDKASGGKVIWRPAPPETAAVAMA